jgi:hypothetical protein|tara:strand:- start:2487 stop:3491 length:1005 start_codon:yes stop_codon:yes gene_type:complete
MVTTVVRGPETRAQKRKRVRDAKLGEAIPGLLDDIVITHVLRSEHFDDPADLARLKAVSCAMRKAVAEKGVRLKEIDEEEAVRLGCLGAVQRLDRRGRLSGKELLCAAAAMSGQLEELKLLRENGCPWDEWTCACAADGGHLEMMQWAHANGCPWDWKTCAWAANSGHREVLQWAHANGCPWDEKTCCYAALGGNLDLLQWARENGCPWDEKTCSSAAEGGHPEVLQWARENGCPWDETKLTIIAAQFGHESVVRALIELGADVNKARNDGVTPLYIAAQVGHEAVVRALIEAGVNVNRAADDDVTSLYVGAQQGHEAGAGADRGGRGRQQGKK